MKTYKNWYKKFVPDYALQKASTTESISSMDSNQDSLKKTYACLNVSTLLPNSLVHQLLHFILTISSVILVYKLNIPSSYAGIISLFMICLMFYYIYKLRNRRKTLHNLQCIDHVWFLKYTEGHYEQLQLQSISSGLGFLYQLNFVDRSDIPVKICIWKYQSELEFLAYCSQLFSIGQKDA